MYWPLTKNKVIQILFKLSVLERVGRSLLLEFYYYFIITFTFVFYVDIFKYFLPSCQIILILAYFTFVCFSFFYNFIFLKCTWPWTTAISISKSCPYQDFVFPMSMSGILHSISFFTKSFILYPKVLF